MLLYNWTDSPHCEFNIEFWLLHFSEGQQKELEALERWQRIVMKRGYGYYPDSVWERKRSSG